MTKLDYIGIFRGIMNDGTYEYGGWLDVNLGYRWDLINCSSYCCNRKIFKKIKMYYKFA